MPVNLTDRQLSILKAIIEEYINTAEPVGSEAIERKYSIGVSPATIRNEMVNLTQQGFLKQLHTSAGRIPTAMALKLYVKELMKEKPLSVAEEVSTKEQVWDYRHNIDRLLQQATLALANQTQTIAVTCTNQGHAYSAGYAHILDMPEFYDIDVTRHVLAMLDQTEQLFKLFSRAVNPESIHVLFGEELDDPYLEPVSYIYADFQIGPDLYGKIGLIGPARLNYPFAVPRVRYFSQLINEIARNW